MSTRRPGCCRERTSVSKSKSMRTNFRFARGRCPTDTFGVIRRPALPKPSSLRSVPMVRLPATLSHDLRVQRVVRAETDDFSELVRIAGLDPKRHLRFADWSGVSFQNCNLRGFDFTGARLLGCDFAGALISEARFDQAEIGREGAEATSPATRLRDAADWHKHVDLWTPSDTPPSDDRLPGERAFQEAPAAPELTVRTPASSDQVAFRGSDCTASPIPPLAPVALSPPVTVEQFVAFQQWKDRFGTSFMKVLGLLRSPKRGSWRHPESDDAALGRPIAGVTYEETSAYVQWLSY